MAQVTVEAQYIADTAQYVRALRNAAAATSALADQIPGAVRASDDLNRSSRELGEGAKEASKGFSVLRNAMGTALGVAAVNLVTNLTGRLKGFAKASFDAAARVEELDIAMNSIGKATGLGADTIRDATQAIRDNGIELAAAQQIAIEFAQNQLDLASASKVARVAQDLAVIAGQNSTATTQLLTQAIITGNSMLLKSAGISRLASEGYADYAKEIGKTVRQLSAQERQQAVTNLILQEGERVAGTYEGAMNAAGKVLRSFKRIINDIQVEIGKVLLNAFGPLIKATYDLLKAFSTTMRDGGALTNTLSMLSTSFQELTQPLVDFIKNLTASVKSGEAMTNIGDAVEQIIPPLMTAVETVRALAATWASVLIPAIRALTPLLTAVANLLTPILQLFTRLPEPIRMVIGLFILMNLAMKRSVVAAKVLGVSWGTLATTFTTRTKAMMVSIKAFEIRIKTAMIAAKTQMGALAAAAKVMSAGVVTSFRAMGVAVRGFFAALGPVGLALIGVTIAFEALAGKSADAEAKVESLRDTIDETTGAFTELSKQQIMLDLSKQLSPQDQAALRELGLGVEEMAEAIIQGGPAIEAMGQKFNDAIGPSGRIKTNILGIKDAVVVAERNFGGYAKIADEALRQQEQASLDAAAAQQRAAVETAIALNTEMAKQKEREQTVISSLLNMTEVEKKQKEFSIQKSQQMAAATDAATRSIEALDAAMQNLNDALAAEATYDNARRGIVNLNKQFKEGKTKIKGYSEEALNNRKAIRDAAQGYIDYANSLSDPIERQNALEEGQKRIRKALKAADIDPKDSDILKTLKQQAEQSGKTVDEFAAQREIAEQYGNDVGKNFIDGIIEELKRGKSQVDAGGADAVSGMVDAAESELGIQSPSRKAMKIAKDFIDGVVVGVKNEKKVAEMEISDFGQSLVDALEERLSGFQQVVKTAGEAFRSMRDVTRGGEDMFGEPSQILSAFGEDASIGGAISMYDQLDAMIRDAYAPFMDAEMFGEREAERARRAMERERARLKDATAEVVGFLREREAALEDIQTIRDNTALQIEGINERYDGLDDAANNAIKSIESKWSGIIPGLQSALSAANEAFQRENTVLDNLIRERDSFLDRIGSGLRSFANELAKSTKRVVRTTQDLGNGLTISTETEVTDVGSFREGLEARLTSIREFTANIRTLLARGLDPSLVQDFVSAGVGSAGDTVAALAGAADSELAAINSAQSSLNAEIASFQQSASAQWYDAGIAQQEAVVAPLRASAEAAQRALDQAQAARESELAAARAHAETLKNMRATEIKAAEDARDAELDRLRTIVDDIEKKELPARAAAIQAIFTNLQTTLPPQMQRVGRKAINGIIRGLNDREPALIARARQIGNSIKAALEAALQVSSPSRVTQTIGQQVAQGLIDGMRESEKSVARAASSLADQIVVPVAQPTFPGVAGGPRMDYTTPMGAGGGPVMNMNLTVNAGMGTDGAEVGRQIVESIKRFERTNGPVFAGA